jgi:hypothetical protein
MAIQKQEFYEGAALYALVRAGRVRSIIYRHPFFVINDRSPEVLNEGTKSLVVHLWGGRAGSSWTSGERVRGRYWDGLWSRWHPGTSFQIAGKHCV